MSKISKVIVEKQMGALVAEAVVGSKSKQEIKDVLDLRNNMSCLASVLALGILLSAILSTTICSHWFLKD